MTLGEQQERFTYLVHTLLGWLQANGYKVRMGECQRTMSQGLLNYYGGEVGYDSEKGLFIKPAPKCSWTLNSMHLSKLAMDLHIFKNGKYLDTVEALRHVGNYWVLLDRQNLWGGDFPKKDAFHFQYGN